MGRFSEKMKKNMGEARQRRRSRELFIIGIYGEWGVGCGVIWGEREIERE